jgi:hypothetical protein
MRFDFPVRLIAAIFASQILVLSFICPEKMCRACQLLYLRVTWFALRAMAMRDLTPCRAQATAG